MKKYLVFVAALLALTAVSACQKKESAPTPAVAPTAPADAAKPGDTTAPAAPAPAPGAPAEKSK